MRFFKILIFIIILLAGVSAIAIYWTFYRPLPNRATTVKLSQLKQPVQIKWDDYGVPHIYAENKHDLYFALGYVHAQDRRWQMTVSQLAVQGRFAEFFGKKFLPIDKLQRTIGFWRIAKKMQKNLTDSTRRILQAYADGVNDYTTQNGGDLPIQFSLSGVKPIPWSPIYSLALARLMAWQLNISWKEELTYNLIYQKLGGQKFNKLFSNTYVKAALPDSTVTKDSTLAASIRPILNSAQKYDKIMHMQGTHIGSNAWAVSGKKTDSGKPLLAGDPHSALSIPGPWYEVQLNIRGNNLSGITLPGLPSVIQGHNDALAWSFTNMMLDNTDFFEEKINPKDSNQYLIDSLAGKAVYQKFEVQHEVIKIKNAEDRFFTRKLSNHGPVISDIYPRQNTISDKVISVKWAGQQAGSELRGLQIMNWAQNIQTFKKGIRKLGGLALNVIYADTTGNIGRFAAAKVPLRSGNPILLRPGWIPQMDWHGFVNKNELPKSVNPQKGWVANANNRIGKDHFSHYLSVFWQPETRYNRIKEYLSGNRRLSTEAFQIMQNDTYSAYAKSVTKIILPVLKNSRDSTFNTPIKYLSNWDYTYDKSETAASIMDVFLLHLAKNTLHDELGKKTYQQFIRYSAKPARILLRILKNNSFLFDDVTTVKKETKADMIRRSMHEALSMLRDRFGNNPAGWHWRKLHAITLRPSFYGATAEDSSASSILKLIVENVLSKGPYPAAGNGTTLNNGEYLWNSPYRMKVGPSYRQIVDLSDMQKSLSIMPGGQSGNPLSQYYNDQTQSWLNGQYKYLNEDSSRFYNYKNMQMEPINRN